MGAVADVAAAVKAAVTPRKAKDGYCIVVYDGSKVQAEHLRARFSLMHQEFVTGEEREIPALFAGALLASAPQGTVKVLDGKPKEWNPKPPAEVTRERELADLANPWLAPTGS